MTLLQCSIYLWAFRSERTNKKRPADKGEASLRPVSEMGQLVRRVPVLAALRAISPKLSTSVVMSSGS